MSPTIKAYASREDWLAARNDGKGIGGSDIAGILGVSPYSTPLSVWSRILGLVPPMDETYSLARGRHMEPFIAEKLAAEAGIAVIPYTSPVIATGAEPWMRYSPDGIALEADDTTVLVEFKSHPRGASDWSEAVPPNVVAQVQWGMFIMDLPRAYVGVDLGTELAWGRVERDPEWWPTHEATIRGFWRMVETQEPPPPSDGDAETLARIYPRASAGKTIALPGDFLDVRWELDEIGARMKELEKRKEELLNRVRAEMKDAERAVLPSGDGWSWMVSETRCTIPDPSGKTRTSRGLRSFKAKAK